MAEMHTPKETVYGYTKDGRQYIVARGGVPLPMDKAIALGIVKEPKRAQPAETKGKGKPSAEQDPTNPPDPPKGKQGK